MRDLGRAGAADVFQKAIGGASRAPIDASRFRNCGCGSGRPGLVIRSLFGKILVKSPQIEDFPDSFVTT